jgi:hypothetical protein
MDLRVAMLKWDDQLQFICAGALVPLTFNPLICSHKWMIDMSRFNAVL